MNDNSTGSGNNDSSLSNATNVGNSNLLKQFYIKRRTIKGALTRFTTFIDLYTDDQIFQLESRLNDILPLLGQFVHVQEQIEFINENESESDELITFENRYFSITGIAKRIINEYNERKQAETINRSFSASNSIHSVHSNQNSLNCRQESNCTSQASNVRFPVLELPKFYGEYEKWGQFRDMFTALVHNDSSLDNIKKFYYLLSCLKSDAAKVLENMEVTSENYVIAWDLLKSRFENKSIIIKNHVKALCELPAATKDTHLTLRKLTDDLQKHVRSLKTLGEPVDTWSTILIYLVTQKLDSVTQIEWEEYIISRVKDTPQLNDLIIFLSQRCQLLEAVHREKNDNKNVKHDIKNQRMQNYSKKTNSNERSFSGVTTRFTLSCFYCKENHPIFLCDKLKAMPVASRITEIKNLKLCTNCLRNNHDIRDCTAQGCKRCGKKHNTMLHINYLETKNVRNSGSSGTTQNENRNAESTETNENCSVSNQSLILTGLVSNNNQENRKSQILLSTATILIKGIQHEWHQCRALLDNGSQPNFITRRLAETLKLPILKASAPVIGVGKSQTTINNKLITSIKSLHTDFRADLTFLILDKITENLPTSSFDSSALKIPPELVLADRDYNLSKEVDVLLGAEVFYDLLCSGQIKLGATLPILQRTRLGWVISGFMPFKHTVHGNDVLSCHLAIDNSLERQLERFWEIEEMPMRKNRSVEEEKCEKIFIETLERDETGHFSVNLPIKENAGILGDSLQNAIKRLYSVERKFAKNPNFKQQYTSFMNEYEALGHMTKLEPQEINSVAPSNIFYLPHHGVINEASLTTKLRVVFDGSCKSSSGISLNDLLMVGPTIQDDLFAILLRFRQHNFVLTADVAKMYRQVKVTESQRDLQRVIWRSNADEEIKHYRLNTVTYGLASSAFLAVRSLQQAAIELKQIYPEASKVVLQDFYVDDLLSGSHDLESTIKLKHDLTQVLGQYGFELRKWVANDVRILGKANFDPNDEYSITDDETRKVLGLRWQASTDILKYTVHESYFPQNKITKRSILSSISKIFDPLGLISPATVQAKVMLQHLWQTKTGWDEAPPEDIITLWSNFSKQLLSINSIQIPRHVLDTNYSKIEIHGFCDASQKAYGACIYLKSTDSSENSTVRLLCAKSRVAPLKIITLPRLELCGAHLLAQLYVKVKGAIQITLHDTYFWCDSTIVLSWLSCPPNTWKLFVANRVADIQNSTDIKQWRHISSTDNPADIVSRGIEPTKLESCLIWWSGPAWLAQDKSCWPKNEEFPDSVPERRKVKITLTSTVKDFSIFEKFSTLYKLQRIIALCFRFFKNCSVNRTQKLTGQIKNEELNHALTLLIKLSQSESFSYEIRALQLSKHLSRHSKILPLNPFLDSSGLLRIGGRLEKADLSFEQKHPLILCPKHPLTRLIILNEHHRQLHAGAQSILASLRQHYWPLNGRATVRNVLRKCITCFRANPSSIFRKMANLPIDRITPNRPFYVTGIDFAGPFKIKDGKLRNRAIIKAYLCVFICFSTKAVHLECVGDLSTVAFLNALNRFVARRGLCKLIYTDNGTNFVGASNELKQLYSQLNNFHTEPSIADFLLKNNIEWRFIPPRSPHRGGLWEAAVKRAKYHLVRIVGNNVFTFEELSTLFAKIEAVMNSRPLTPLSNDPRDFAALTPGHFLIGNSLTSLPQADLTSLPTNRLNQFRLLQQATQQFWNRWSKEYLSSLQQRTKWAQSQEDSLKENSMVLLKDENTPPMLWKIGRITKLHFGDDGVARTATIKTSSGETTRAVQRICLLPVEV